MQTTYSIWSPLLSASELNSFFNGMSQKQKQQLPKHECLIVLLHCTSSLDSLLGDSLLGDSLFSTSTSVRQEAYPSQAISNSRMQKVNFSTIWHVPTLTDSGPTSLVYNLLWDTSAKYRWHHAVQISDSTDFNFWTNSQIHGFLFCNLFFLWYNTRFVLFPLETLLTQLSYISHILKLVFINKSFKPFLLKSKYD